MSEVTFSSFRQGAENLSVDASNAEDRAAAWLEQNGGGTIRFEKGTYAFKQTCLIQGAGSVELLFDAGAVIDCSDMAFNSNDRASGCAFRFEGSAGGSTTLSQDAAKDSFTITVTSAAGFAVGQLIRIESDQIMQAQPTVPVTYVNVNRIVKVDGTTITLKFPLDLPFVLVDPANTVTSYNVTVKTFNLVSNISLRGGVFRGGGFGGSARRELGNGSGPVGVAGYFVDGFHVDGAVFDGFQGYAVVTDSCIDVSVADTHMIGLPLGVELVAADEGKISGFYGLQANRCLGVVGRNCRGDRVRHLFDGVYSWDFKQLDSQAWDTHRAAFGSHGGVRGLLVAGNTARNCYTGGTVRALSSRWIGNDFESWPTTDCFTTFVGTDGDVPSQLEMSDNRIVAAGASRRAVAISGNFDRLLIDTPNFQGGGGALHIYSQWLENVDVKGGNLSVLSAGSCFEITTTGGLAHLRNVNLTGISLVCYTVNGICLRGSLDIGDPAEAISVKNNSGFPKAEGSGNMVLVRSEGWYGDNIELLDNTNYADSSETLVVQNVNAGRFRSAPRNENNGNYLPPSGVSSYRSHRIIGRGVAANAAAVNVTGSATVLPGNIFLNLQPGAGQPSRFFCTVAGTEGTVSGVTGSGSATSSTLTLSGNVDTKVCPGMFINVAGAGPGGTVLKTRVTALSSDFATATVSPAVSTTVSGAAVSRANPTWKTGETLAA